MSLRAYQNVARSAENPRDAEYRLFGQVTRALMEAAKADKTDLRTRIDALDWNRRLWSALATDCADPSNQMPDAARAQIISLSIWVAKYTSQCMREGEDIEALVDVNRIIMQGLAGAQEAA